MSRFISTVDAFVNQPEASAQQKIEQLIKSQVHWTDQDVDEINKRLSHWENHLPTAKNKMVKTILELLGSDEVLLQKLDAAVDDNYHKLTNAIESFYKDVDRVVNSLQSANERKKEANDDVIIEFISNLKDQQSMMNASEIQKKHAEMQFHYVSGLVKVLYYPIVIQNISFYQKCYYSSLGFQKTTRIQLFLSPNCLNSVHPLSLKETLC